MSLSGCSLAGCWPKPFAWRPWLEWRWYPLVGQQDVSLAKLVGQRVSLAAVGDLSTGQAQGDGAPFGIDERMDLARKPAAGMSHAAIVAIPLFPVAACW